MNGWGLSPLARGNPMLIPCGLQLFGPIPAGAGEPTCRPSGWTYIRAYPRWRGGTYDGTVYLIASQGLSPLARGNRSVRHGRASADGPIPAGAGEPMAAA